MKSWSWFILVPHISISCYHNNAAYLSAGFAGHPFLRGIKRHQLPSSMANQWCNKDHPPTTKTHKSSSRKALTCKCLFFKNIGTYPRIHSGRVSYSKFASQVRSRRRARDKGDGRSCWCLFSLGPGPDFFFNHAVENHERTRCFPLFRVFFLLFSGGIWRLVE